MRSIWLTFAVRRWRGERWRSRRRDGITSCSSVRRGVARRCWRGGCRASCRACRSTRRWRSRRFTRWRGNSSPAAASLASGRFARPITRCRTLPSPVAARAAAGEISLAHHGVLFLDELPEFNRRSIEVLRQPIEEGHVLISRASGSMTFPARFMLVAAMNPCPCGYLEDTHRECRCTPVQIQQYQQRVSGPMRDRLDLVVHLLVCRSGC